MTQTKTTKSAPAKKTAAKATTTVLKDTKQQAGALAVLNAETKKTPKPTPAPTPAPVAAEPAVTVLPAVALPGTDLSFLDPKAGPYVAHIALGNTTAVAEALTLAKIADDGTVLIFAADGKMVRLIDWVQIKAMKKAARKSGTGRAGRPKADGPSAMVRKTIELAMRPQGVTREELRTVSDKGQPWTAIIKKAAETYGYDYSTQAPTEAQGGRVAYRLIPTNAAVVAGAEVAAAEPKQAPAAAVAVKRPARKVAKGRAKGKARR